MLTGVGVETIGGILVVIAGGEFTPLSCYVGLGPSGGGDSIELAQPVGSLGCEYDVERVRFFVEHLSSPDSATDNPGFNHVGGKYLFPVAPFTAYLGGSYAFDSPQNNLGNFTGIAGIETNGDVRFYAEHIHSMTNFSESHSRVGIKVVF